MKKIVLLIGDVLTLGMLIGLGYVYAQSYILSPPKPDPHIAVTFMIAMGVVGFVFGYARCLIRKEDEDAN